MGFKGWRRVPRFLSRVSSTYMRVLEDGLLRVTGREDAVKVEFLGALDALNDARVGVDDLNDAGAVLRVGRFEPAADSDLALEFLDLVKVLFPEHPFAVQVLAEHLLVLQDHGQILVDGAELVHRLAVLVQVHFQPLVLLLETGALILERGHLILTVAQRCLQLVDSAVLVAHLLLQNVQIPVFF